MALVSRREGSKDGKTGYERLNGKRGAVRAIEFGGTIMLRKLLGQRVVHPLSIVWVERSHSLGGPIRQWREYGE